MNLCGVIPSQDAGLKENIGRKKLTLQAQLAEPMKSKAKIHELFNKLVENKSLKVAVSSRTAYDNLRTRLVKLFTAHKDTLDSLGVADDSNLLSVCGTYDVVTKVATYRIAERSNAAKESYEMIEEVGDSRAGV